MKNVVIGLTALLVALVAPDVAKVSGQEQEKVEHQRDKPKSEVVEESRGKTVVKGQLVCRTCYLKNKLNTLIEHEGVPENDEGMPEECAITCSKKGMPLALLTKDGKLYTITGALAAVSDVENFDGGHRLIRRNEPNGQLVTNLSHTITIFGDVTEKNGELQLNSIRREWLSDSKDWRVGSTTETKYSEGGKVIEGGK